MTEVVKLAKGEVFQNIWKNFASKKTDFHFSFRLSKNQS